MTHVAVFAPLDDGAVRSDAVVRRLAGAIALGLIADGEQLPPEAELATSLRVAVVTLREALADLRRRGLVQTRRGRGGGSFVRFSEEALADLARRRSAELGTTDLRELGEFHAAVAGAAARLAAERAGAHDLARLDGIIAAFAATDGPAERRRIEGRLHIEIAAAAQSVRLTMAQLEIQTRLTELDPIPADPAGTVAQTLAAHAAVLDAIRDRDADAARRLAEAHIARQTRALIHRRLATGAGHGAPRSRQARAPVEALIDRVFGAVDRLRDGVLGARVDPAAVQARVRELLAEHRDLVIGMGMIVAPGAAVGARRRILWWQDLGGPEPTALQVDLNPHSLGFYDYGRADWFSVPRDSGGRYVDGPYVDVHGTDRYLLTFTAPVVVGGEFLGVVGADVPVTRLETQLLRAWSGLGAEVVVVNADERVVVGNTADALPGERHPVGVGRSVAVSDVGWHLCVTPVRAEGPTVG
jgi:DNA-binding FadR family transcriptional regulator